MRDTMRFLAHTSIQALLMTGAIGSAVLFSSNTVAAQEDRLLALARESAIVAGGARFCKYDPDDIEDFTAKAEAKLSAFAKDEYEKILARLEFKNLLDAYSVKEPQGGCGDFRLVFDRSRRNVQ